MPKIDGNAPKLSWSQICVKIEEFCDEIPLVSIFDNLMVLAYKVYGLFSKAPQPSDDASNAFYTHVKAKSFSQCIGHMVPFGKRIDRWIWPVSEAPPTSPTKPPQAEPSHTTVPSTTPPSASTSTRVSPSIAPTAPPSEGRTRGAAPEVPNITPAPSPLPPKDLAFTSRSAAPTTPSITTSAPATSAAKESAPKPPSPVFPIQPPASQPVARAVEHLPVEPKKMAKESAETSLPKPTAQAASTPAPQKVAPPSQPPKATTALPPAKSPAALSSPTPKPEWAIDPAWSEEEVNSKMQMKAAIESLAGLYEENINGWNGALILLNKDSQKPYLEAIKEEKRKIEALKARLETYRKGEVTTVDLVRVLLEYDIERCKQKEQNFKLQDPTSAKAEETKRLAKEKTLRAIEKSQITDLQPEILIIDQQIDRYQQQIAALRAAIARRTVGAQLDPARYSPSVIAASNKQDQTNIDKIKAEIVRLEVSKQEKKPALVLLLEKRIQDYQKQIEEYKTAKYRNSVIQESATKQDELAQASSNMAQADEHIKLLNDKIRQTKINIVKAHQLDINLRALQRTAAINESLGTTGNQSAQTRLVKFKQDIAKTQNDLETLRQEPQTVAVPRSSADVPRGGTRSTVAGLSEDTTATASSAAPSPSHSILDDVNALLVSTTGAPLQDAVLLTSDGSTKSASECRQEATIPDYSLRTICDIVNSRGKRSREELESALEVELSDTVTLEPLKDAHTLSCGHSFSRTSITELSVVREPKCPCCRTPLDERKMVSNQKLQAIADAYFASMG